VEGTDDVGLDEVAGAVNGAVDVALGRKIDHGARLVLEQQGGHQRRVAKIAFYKDMAIVTVQRGQVLQIAGVGEFVEVDDQLIRLGQPVEHKIAANKTGAAGDEDTHRGFVPENIKLS